MEQNEISSYLKSGNYVGFDRYLKVQLKSDGWFAERAGITNLGPTGFLLGFLVCYLWLEF